MTGEKPPQGTIAWCYDYGRRHPKLRTPPITAGIPGSAAWRAFRKGQRDAKKR